MSCFLLLLAPAFALDLHHDGIDDLVIATPGEDYAGEHAMVSVLSGSSIGLVADEYDYFLTDLCGTGSTEEPEDVVAIDLLDNGYGDVIFQTADGLYALLGGPSGVSACWRLDVGDIEGVVTADLAVGDFDGDGDDDLVYTGSVGLLFVEGPLLEDWSLLDASTDYDSLAVGDWNADHVDDLAAAGAYGTDIWHGSRSAGPIHVRSLASYSNPALAAGDFDGDGDDDLAVGEPEWAYCTLTSGSWCLATNPGGAGYVDVYRGQARYGLGTTVYRTLTQDTAGIATAAETGDGFGARLLVADWNGDGRDDLAVSAPEESYAATADGLVHVLFGSSTTLTGTGSLTLSQAISGYDGDAEDYEGFGARMTTGDWNHDGRPDIALFAQYEGLDTAGSVHVMYGYGTYFSSLNDAVYDQVDGGITGTPEDGDWFGWVMR